VRDIDFGPSYGTLLASPCQQNVHIVFPSKNASCITFSCIQKPIRISHTIDLLFKIQNAIYVSSFSFDVDFLLCMKIICDCVTLQFECFVRLHRFMNFWIYGLHNWIFSHVWASKFSIIILF